MKPKNLTPFPFGTKAPRPELPEEISFGRTGAAAVLFLVAGLSGCMSVSGSLHFEGSDPVGPFSGDVNPTYCNAWFERGNTNVFFARGRLSDVIDPTPDGITVSTRGARWTLRSSACRAFDFRHWFDGEKHLHVVIAVDCTSDEGVHVHGSVYSPACDVDRPGTPVP